jgi:hypothetical protein
MAKSNVITFFRWLIFHHYWSNTVAIYRRVGASYPKISALRHELLQAWALRDVEF